MDDATGLPTSALLEASGLGDRDAFAALCERLLRPVYSEARRRSGDCALAEDATQIVFEKLWRFSHRFAPEAGSAEGWIFTITRNTVRDLQRRRARELPSPDLPDLAEEEAPEDSDRGHDPPVVFRIHAAVQRLPDRLREPIELAYWHGLSQSEIAKAIGLPLGTVKTRTRAALSRLSAELTSDAAMPVGAR